MENRGVPLVVSAPSGAGKTTLCRTVMKQLHGLAFSISHTTRPARPTERNGIDYHFVDPQAFQTLIDNNVFLEWADVHSKRYGTARMPVEERLTRGHDVLFDIDVEGGRQIAARLPDAVLLFILPPSMTELERRLRGRGTDNPAQIDQRLHAAAQEIEAAGSLYTHWLVNDDLETAVDQLRSLIVGERLRRADHTHLAAAFSRGKA